MIDVRRRVMAGLAAALVIFSLSAETCNVPRDFGRKCSRENRYKHGDDCRILFNE
jgi:hypothetical protein